LQHEDGKLTIRRFVQETNLSAECVNQSAVMRLSRSPFGLYKVRVTGLQTALGRQTPELHSFSRGHSRIEIALQVRRCLNGAWAWRPPANLLFRRPPSPDTLRSRNAMLMIPASVTPPARDLPRRNDIPLENTLALAPAALIRCKNFFNFT
jgi:hypothetical protein